MHGLIIKCAFLLNAFGHATSQLPVWYGVSTDAVFGRVIYVFCKGGTSDYRWIFANKTLAQNNELVEADSTRYSVSVGYISTYNYGSLLLIRNALRDDGGWYECQKEYYSDGKLILTSEKVFVPVNYYLPSLSYPKCQISPSLTLFDNSYATFNCTTGESSSVNLLLTLQYQNGSIVELGHNVVTKKVTLNDNNATFICHMTSDIFLAAYRDCSAGPITVKETKSLSTTIQSTVRTTVKSTKDTKMITTFVPNPTKGQDSDENSSTKLHFIYGIIIIGSIAAFLLVIVGAIFCCFVTLRKSKLEENNPIHMPAIRNTSGNRNPPNQEESYDITSRQGNLGQIPVYAEVQEPSSQNLREPVITYADTNSSTIPEESVTFPIYSEVKDAEEIDKSNNETNDEESTGMVKNAIYVSSGPV